MKLADKVLMELISKLINKTQSILLPNFHMKFANQGESESDLFQLTDNDWTIEYEIKTSKSDLKNDFDKTIWFNHYIYKKHDVILSGNRTNRFYFVIPKEFTEDKRLMEFIPHKYGIITFDFEQKYKWEVFKYYRQAKVLHKNKTIYRDFVVSTALSKYNFLYIKYVKSQQRLMEGSKCKK